MLEILRTWLNGPREYYTGVSIYSSFAPSEPWYDLMQIFQEGKNEFRQRRLEKELLLFFQKLNNEEAHPGKPKNEKTKEGIKAPEALAQGIPNEELYQSCKLAADKPYKEVMNSRAVLFALCNTKDFTDPNTQERIKERTKLSLDVVTGFNSVSQLYETANYVKMHGHLPDQGETAEENEYDHLPDSLVKQTLNNLRKNINKMKNREQTPERVALLQKHEINIKKLEARWLLLKPA